MSFEWTQTTLGDVCLKITDGAHASPKSVAVGKPMASVKDMTRFGIDLSAARLISAADFESLVKQGCRPEIGDVLIAKDGNSALDTVCNVKNSLDAVLLSSVAILRPNPEKIDTDFLKFYLSSSDVVEYLKSTFISGAAIPRVVLRDFKKAEINIPPLSIQKEIAKVLNAVEDRIFTLRETNTTLEAIAQALFKSWFVDFDPVHAKMQGRAPEGMDQATAALFPVSFEDSELGSVPKGWRVGKLGDVFTLRNERIKPSEATQSLPYVPIECITAKVPFLQEFKSGAVANSSLVIFHEGDILFGAMRPYFHKVCIAPFNGVTRTTVFTLRAKNQKSSCFALFLAYQDATIEYATQHSDGSTIPYAKWKDSLELMPIIFPPESVQIAFAKSRHRSLGGQT